MFRLIVRKIKNDPNRKYSIFRGEAEDGKLRFGAFSFYGQGLVTASKKKKNNGIFFNFECNTIMVVK